MVGVSGGYEVGLRKSWCLLYLVTLNFEIERHLSWKLILWL